MSWTVIIEDEKGNAKRTMPQQFKLTDEVIINNETFKLLKYLDPYGDTTFNNLMFDDLRTDLIQLKKLLPLDLKLIDIVIEYIKECEDDVHTYLKFYGE
jgi:regulator of sigma D